LPDTLYTIGYEGASLHDFIATLRSVGVRRLVDVREIALSRRKGFSKTALSQALNNAGIEYFHFKALGDPKAGREAARAGRISEFREIFNAHLSNEKAKLALAELAELASEKTSCFLCFERNHTECHRTIVADRIRRRTRLTVRHIGVTGYDGRKKQCGGNASNGYIEVR
jgi:uncharacterized protein (DUF488 family)